MALDDSECIIDVQVQGAIQATWPSGRTSTAATPCSSCDPMASTVINTGCALDDAIGAKFSVGGCGRADGAVGLTADVE